MGETGHPSPLRDVSCEEKGKWRVSECVILDKVGKSEFLPQCYSDRTIRTDANFTNSMRLGGAQLPGLPFIFILKTCCSIGRQNGIGRLTHHLNWFIGL